MVYIYHILFFWLIHQRTQVVSISRQLYIMLKWTWECRELSKILIRQTHKTVDANINWCRHWWKTIWHFLKKKKIELPCDPTVLLLAIYLKVVLLIFWTTLWHAIVFPLKISSNYHFEENAKLIACLLTGYSRKLCWRVTFAVFTMWYLVGSTFFVNVLQEVVPNFCKLFIHKIVFTWFWIILWW